MPHLDTGNAQQPLGACERSNGGLSWELNTRMQTALIILSLIWLASAAGVFWLFRSTTN